MVARALLVALALEVVGYLALARHATAAGWAPLATAGTILAIHVGLRAVVVLLGYAIAWPAGARPADAALRPLACAGLVAREIFAMWRNYLLVPLERWLPPEPALTGPGAPRVVLVHGMLCNRAVWWRFRRALAARGHPAHAVTLEPVLGSLDDMADALARAMRDADGPLYVVAHSMGGLVARRLLQRHPRIPIRGLVTLGTPHRGSIQARLAFGKAGRSLCERSPWLAALEAGGAPTGVRCLALWSWHDELVSPAGSCRWAAAEEGAFAGIGHVELLWSPRVVDAVAECLDRWTRAAPPVVAGALDACAADADGRDARRGHDPSGTDAGAGAAERAS